MIINGLDKIQNLVKSENSTALWIVVITSLTTILGHWIASRVKNSKAKSSSFQAMIDANVEYREELRKDLIVAKNELLDCKKIIEDLNNRILKLNDQIDKDKEIKDLIKQCEDRFINLANSVPLGIFRADIKGNPIFVNKYLCELKKTSYEELLQGAWKKTIHPSDYEEVIKEWDKAVRTHSNFELEYRYKLPNEEVIYVKTIASREETIEGKLVGFVGVVIPLHVLGKDKEV